LGTKGAFLLAKGLSPVIRGSHPALDVDVDFPKVALQQVA
jgi:hypothetical protein